MVVVPACSGVDFERIGATGLFEKLIDIIEFVRIEDIIGQFDRDDKIVFVVEICRIPVMSHNFFLLRSYLFVCLQNSIPSFRSKFVQVGIFSFEIVISEDLVSIVESHLKVEHQMPMVVGEEEAIMFTACGVIGYQFVMEAGRCHLVVGDLSFFWTAVLGEVVF